MSTLIFIEHNPNIALRQRELVTARVRAHTARISHARNRTQRTRSSSTSVSKENEKEEERASTPLSFPMLLGNTDPFNSFDLEITPEIYRILTFSRNGALAAHYMPLVIRKMSDTGQLGDFGKADILLGWQDILLSLQDEGIALARLTTYSQYLNYFVQDSAELKMSVTSMRRRSLHLLRKKLERYTDNLSVTERSSLQRHIFGLFDAECFCGNPDVANVHGRALQRLALNSDGINFSMSLRLLYIICHTAAATGRRTLPSIAEWISCQLELYLEKSVPACPLGVSGESVLHEIIKLPRLRSIFIRRKYLMSATMDLIQGHNSEVARGMDDKQALYAYVFTSSIIDLSRLNDMYHDLNEGALMGQSRSTERYTMAAISLALNYLTRELYGDLTINDINFHDYSSTMLKTLRLTIASAYKEGDDQDRAELAPAFLWVFYVGATYEHRKGYITATIPSLDMVWFSPLLIYQAKLLNINTWAQMETVAQQFFCTCLIEPNGSTWFEPLLEKYDVESHYVKLALEMLCPGILQGP